MNAIHYSAIYIYFYCIQYISETIMLMVGPCLRLPQCNLDYVVASHQLCRIPIFISSVQPQYQYIVHTEQFSFATYIDHL
jgi:hypothetical protein